MPVEDVFSITGRGTVATGRVERGVLKVSDEVEIVGIADEIHGGSRNRRREMFRKLLDQAQTGDNIGALLRGVQRTDIERGQVLAAPGSVHPHTKFKGEVYVLEEGRRRKTYARSSTDTDRSSTSERQTSQEHCSYRQEQKCACLEQRNDGNRTDPQDSDRRRTEIRDQEKAEEQ